MSNLSSSKSTRRGYCLSSVVISQVIYIQGPHHLSEVNSDFLSCLFCRRQLEMAIATNLRFLSTEEWTEIQKQLVFTWGQAGWETLSASTETT